MAATPEHAARVLGLTIDANLQDIRRVRRDLALKYHPDRCRNSIVAARHMARINAAVDTLVAHINARAKREASRMYWGDRAADFCKAVWSASAAPQSNAKPSQTEPPSPSREHAAEMAGFAESQAEWTHPVVSQADKELVRFAADSYRSALDRISQIDVSPTIDVRVAN